MIRHSVLHLLFAVLYCSAEKSQRTRNLGGNPGEGYYVEVLIGTPPQKFNVLVDTGSTNFGIAAGLNLNVDTYFVSQNSSTYRSKDTEVSVVYSLGYWEGELGNDVVMFPSLNTPVVRCDTALIYKSAKFFMNGSHWQGILGLAYPSISSPDSSVLSWIEALEQHRNKLSAFSLELCGTNGNEKTHTGSFSILDEEENDNVTVYTSPMFREYFYEVIVTGMSVGNKNVDLPCTAFNAEKTILDSGTTSLRLSVEVFQLVIEMINATAQQQNVSLPDDFLLLQKTCCWKQVLNVSILPNISLSLLHSDNSYFTIELPAQAYLRRVHINQETEDPEYCFKSAIESSTTGTVLGVIVMEGFRVVFNRSSRVVSFSISSCGPSVQLHGPFSSDKGLWGCANPLQISALTAAGTAAGVMLCVFGFAMGYFVCQQLIEKYIEKRHSRRSGDAALLSGN